MHAPAWVVWATFVLVLLLVLFALLGVPEINIR